MGWERGDFGLRKTSIRRDLSAFKYMKCYCVYDADSLLPTPPRRGQSKAGLGRRPSSGQKEFSEVEGFKALGCQGRRLRADTSSLNLLSAGPSRSWESEQERLLRTLLSESTTSRKEANAQLGKNSLKGKKHLFIGICFFILGREAACIFSPPFNFRFIEVN